MQPFFRSLDSLILKGEGTINILQIGDSHIQAGFIPEEMRKDFALFHFCKVRGQGAYLSIQDRKDQQSCRLFR